MVLEVHCLGGRGKVGKVGMEKKSRCGQSRWRCRSVTERRTVVVDRVADEEEGTKRGDDGRAARVVRHILVLYSPIPFHRRRLTLKRSCPGRTGP